VYQHKWDDYDASAEYRVKGAVEAQKFGALAVLIRSVTPSSLYTIHVGRTLRNSTIPAAAITIEDADYIDRWIQRGKLLLIFENYILHSILVAKQEEHDEIKICYRSRSYDTS